MNNTRRFALVVALLFITGLYFKFSTPTQERASLSTEATLLAFGDSLTYGFGAVDAAYPKQLAGLIGRDVINAGISGEISAEGLLRLPKLLEEYHPDLVILCHGGNDILRHASKAQLKRNLLAMVSLIKKSGSEVLLVGVPGFGLFGVTTLDLYDEVAEEANLLYEGKVLEQIENNPTLKSDRIHPNAQGYAMMAEAFASVLDENMLLE